MSAPVQSVDDFLQPPIFGEQMRKFFVVGFVRLGLDRQAGSEKTLSVVPVYPGVEAVEHHCRGRED